MHMCDITVTFNPSNKYDSPMLRTYEYGRAFVSLIFQRSMQDYWYSVDKKNQLDVTFVFFISLLIVAQHVSGNHVPIIGS